MNHKDTKTQRREPLLFSSLCLGVFVVQIIFEDAMNKNTKLLLILIAVGLVAMLLCCAPLALLVLFRIAMSRSAATADRPTLQQVDPQPKAELRRPAQQPVVEQPKAPEPGVHLKKSKTLIQQDQVFDGVTVSPDGNSSPCGRSSEKRSASSRSSKERPAKWP